MKLNTRQMPLIIITTTIFSLLVVGITTIGLLYNTAFEQQRARLVETVKSQARLLEAIHRFAVKHNHGASQETVINNTLSQIKDAHANYQGLGKTGEFTLAMRGADDIIFLLNHRHEERHAPEALAFDSALAEPTRQALAGQSGTLVGIDYRGQQVLAAYEPVARLGWGMVAKVDLQEIRAPYITAALLAGSIALVLSVIATIILLKISCGVVDTLAATSASQAAILTAAADSIISIDELGIIQDFNLAAEKLFGYTQNEAKGKNVSMLIPYPEAKYHDHYLKEYQRTGVKKFIGKVRDTLARKKDGTVFPIELSVSEVETTRGKQFLGIIRDISERNKAEEALRKAKEDAELASHAKSEFLARTSHELRTPLNAILGFSQLLQMKKEPLTETQEDSINEIYTAGKHLLEVINEILDLASVESGRVKYHPTSVPLADISNECCSLIMPQTNARGITLINKLENSHFSVHTDPTRFKQILINLLGNAVKYNKHNGTITLDSRQQSDDYLRISITDTGIGIAEDKLALVFNPFERLGAEYTNTEGTGVGLAVTKKLIQEMGGEVGVESSPGLGSTFWFTLKLGDQKQSVIDNNETTNVRFTNRDELNILYIEDDSASQHVMKAITATLGNIDIISADTAEAGIEIAIAQRPDVIFMDINLPGMDGLEALGILQRNTLTQDIPVVALSAAAMTDEINNGLRAGFTAYVAKPVQINEIQSILENINAVRGEVVF